VDEKGFLNYLIETNRSELTINNSLDSMRLFNTFLKTIKINIEDAKPEHLRAFLENRQNDKRVRMHFGPICVYYQYLGNEFMHNAAREISGEILLSKYKLKKFHLVDMELLKKLEEIGIKTAKQMLDAGLTKENRKELSLKTNVPEAYILELVKLSNLARIPGLKKIRARLYYNGGIDTLKKLATWNPTELKKHLDDHAEKTGIAKMGPLLAEATSAISLAKHLPKILEL
jgi:hypothetical protein